MIEEGVGNNEMELHSSVSKATNIEKFPDCFIFPSFRIVQISVENGFLSTGVIINPLISDLKSIY